jgi:hypothetical protein
MIRSDVIKNQVYDDLKVISKDGFIIPLKKWVINFTCDLVYVD